MHFNTLVAAALFVLGTEGREREVSSCDYYTHPSVQGKHCCQSTQIINASCEYCSCWKLAFNITGILGYGTYDGIEVHLRPYFNGGLISTNRGNKATSVNFLDGGDVFTIRENKPANSMSTNQYFLVNHLYQFFGDILRCTKQGGADFPEYSGSPSQYEVHKFMHLGHTEVGYFIEQFLLSARSFGFSSSDLMMVETALRQKFAYRCFPRLLRKKHGPQLPSICTDSSCRCISSNYCHLYDQSITKPEYTPCYQAWLDCVRAPKANGAVCASRYATCKSFNGTTSSSDSDSNFSKGSGASSNETDSAPGSELSKGSDAICNGTDSTSGSDSSTDSSSGSCLCPGSDCACGSDCDSGSDCNCGCGSGSGSGSSFSSSSGSNSSSSSGSSHGSNSSSSSGSAFDSGSGSRSGNKVNGAESGGDGNDTIATLKPAQDTAGAAALSFSFAAIAGGLAAFFL
ncbi:hypothetical protein DID88_010227 [Monilinia fructigena]|uniref:Uncharacterized protein n=1 Tax=Monilinia fructigena TaxID=38457 RepID=A0A395IKK7_9HELO|nr:hypothetical protein DID88_010227 [Monilinia fructigena]